MKELDTAVEALRRNPRKPVIARLPGMTVELRAVETTTTGRSAAEVFAELGPWEGETSEELADLLGARRAQNRTVSGL